MDLCELENKRPLLLPTDDNNGTTRRSRTREVSSRYKSPGPLRTPGPKRSASPNISRVSSTSIVSIPKRAVSAERRHPSTPVKDTKADMLMASRKILGNKAPESLWPSTVRSLNVSFESDSSHVRGNKREETVNDQALRPSLHVARKGEMFASRKPTPEGKRNPFKGNRSVDQPENAKSAENSPARLVNQSQWTSIASGKSKNISSLDQRSRYSSESGKGTPSLRRLSLDGKPSQKSASDLLMLISSSHGGRGKEISDNGLVNDSSLRVRWHGSAKLSDRTPLVNNVGKSQSLLGSRPSSPSVSRGLSPNRAKPVNPSSRGPSPARVRPSSPSSQSQNSNSVLSFIVDVKKGTKTASHIEDVHQLRLLYNRHLQWRYANARSNAVLRSQKIKAEKMLYSVWRKIVDLQDSVIKQRLYLREQKLKLTLHSILNNQIKCLDEWASIEKGHTSSLTCAIQDLQACTIQIPVTGGARVDIGTFKKAVSSAVDVMQTMGSTLGSILSQVERTNSTLSEVACVAALERAMLDECESFLSSTAVLQVEETSLKTHLLQNKRVLAKVANHQRLICYN